MGVSFILKINHNQKFLRYLMYRIREAETESERGGYGFILGLKKVRATFAIEKYNDKEAYTKTILTNKYNSLRLRKRCNRYIHAEQ